MILLSLNVRSRPPMPQGHVVHDVEKAAGSGVGVICWQEIAHARYADAIKALDPQVWETYWPEDGATEPITYRRAQWRRIGAGTIRAHGRVLTICPPRHIVWVLLENRKIGARRLVINTHFIPSAWDGTRTFRDLRRRFWWAHYAALQEFVTNQAAKGLVIVGAGDFNKPRVPAITARCLWPAGHGPDHIFVVPTGTALVRGKAELIEGLYTDHKGVKVALAFNHNR